MSSNIGPDVKTALHKAITHIEHTYQIPVEKVNICIFASLFKFVVVTSLLYSMN